MIWGKIICKQTLGHSNKNVKCIYIYIYLSDFVKTWPVGFRLGPGEARLQASPVRKNVGGGCCLGRYGWIAQGLP